MDEENNKQDADPNTPPETIVIPPENPTTAQVPPEFASPALFKREEELEKEAVVIQNQPQTKTILLVIVGVIVLGLITFGLVQFLLEKKFASIALDQTQGFGDDFVLGDDQNEEDTLDGSSCEGGLPFVNFVSPGEGQILKPGESFVFEWELCGLSTNLFDSAIVEYFDAESQNKIGSFDLACLAGLRNDKRGIVWNIPPYIESSSVGECADQDVDFADSFFYQLKVSYANSQYEALSTPFMIDVSEYVYVAPTFSDYTIPLDTSFSRAFFIDEEAPAPLKEQIFPSYFEAPAQFANYYRVYTLGCGSNCFVGIYLIDLRTGEAFEAPFSASYFVNPTSLLYITTEEDTAIETNTLVTWYLFNESAKSFSFVDSKSCEGSGPESFTNCVQP